VAIPRPEAELRRRHHRRRRPRPGHRLLPGPARHHQRRGARKGYLGGGASGRNTAIIRSNYRTPEGVAFYDESVKLYENLALELDYNVMFSQQGHLTVAHTGPRRHHPARTG